MMSNVRQSSQRSTRRSSWQGQPPSILAPIQEYDNTGLQPRTFSISSQVDPQLPIDFNIARLRREMTTASLLSLNDIVEFDLERPAHVLPRHRHRPMTAFSTAHFYEVEKARCRDASVSFPNTGLGHTLTRPVANPSGCQEIDMSSVSTLCPTRSGNNLTQQRCSRRHAFLCRWLSCLPIWFYLSISEEKREAIKDSPSSTSDSSSSTATSEYKVYDECA